MNRQHAWVNGWLIMDEKVIKYYKMFIVKSRRMGQDY